MPSGIQFNLSSTLELLHKYSFLVKGALIFRGFVAIFIIIQGQMQKDRGEKEQILLVFAKKWQISFQSSPYLNKLKPSFSQPISMYLYLLLLAYHLIVAAFNDLF